jgi:enoyl-CoA hydratase/carnithine racemase
VTTLQRTDSRNQDFRYLVRQLDLELKERYGALQNEYDKYNKIESLETVVIAIADGKAIGCGCFKQFDGASFHAQQ